MIKGHKYRYGVESFKCLLLHGLIRAGIYRGIDTVEAERSHWVAPTCVDLSSLPLPAPAYDGVPRIVFQTWKSKTDIPLNYQIWRASLHKYCFNWCFVLSDDLDNHKFIADRFPWFITTYESYPREIYRADSVRPFLLAAFGGLYLDMDVECLREVSLHRCEGVMFGQMGKDFSLPFSVPNAMMAGRPRQLFWAIYIALMMEIARGDVGEPEDATGPNVLKAAIEIYREADEATIRKRYAAVVDALEESLGLRLEAGTLTILPGHIWYPFNWDDPLQKRLRRAIIKARLIIDARMARRLFRRATFVTYWTHSW